MKDLHQLSTGWVMHRLAHERNPELFNQTIIFLSQRLLTSKRVYNNPVPDGDYFIYLYIDHSTFGGVLFKTTFSDERLVVSETFESLGVLCIRIKGNDVVDIWDEENKNMIDNCVFVQGIALRVLKLMGFSVRIKHA